MTKREIREHKNLHYLGLDGSLTEMVSTINDLIQEYGPEAYIDSEIEHGYYGDTSIEYTIHWTRTETDKEEQKRLDAAKKSTATKRANTKAKKLKKEADDVKEYERLKQKFETV